MFPNSYWYISIIASTKFLLLVFSVCARMCFCVCMHECVLVYVHMCACLCVFVCVHTCTWFHLCVYSYVFMHMNMTWHTYKSQRATYRKRSPCSMWHLCIKLKLSVMAAGVFISKPHCGLLDFCFISFWRYKIFHSPKTWLSG